jgi:Flp pilus assembly pilin Flp
MHHLIPMQLRLLARALERNDHDSEDGQATAEYALVLLGAAAVALLVVSWATKTNVVAKLLDAVFGQLLDRATATR